MADEASRVALVPRSVFRGEVAKSLQNGRKLPFDMEFEETPEELQPMWVAIAASIDDASAPNDPVKRRAAAKGALSAAMKMFQERDIPIAPLLCLQWGLDDLDLGRTPPIFEAIKYGRGGQAPKVEEMCGRAFLAVALEALFLLGTSKIEARQTLRKDLEKRLPSHLKIGQVIQIRDNRSDRPPESRQCDTLEQYRKDFEKGRNKSGEYFEWAVSCYRVLIGQLRQMRAHNADSQQIKSWYERQLESAVQAFCRSLISSQ